MSQSYQNRISQCYICILNCYSVCFLGLEYVSLYSIFLSCMVVVTLYVHLYAVFPHVPWPRHCRGNNTTGKSNKTNWLLCKVTQRILLRKTVI